MSRHALAHHLIAQLLRKGAQLARVGHVQEAFHFAFEAVVDLDGVVFGHQNYYNSSVLEPLQLLYLDHGRLLDFLRGVVMPFREDAIHVFGHQQRTELAACPRVQVHHVGLHRVERRQQHDCLQRRELLGDQVVQQLLEDL